jgi:hypothetical protein
MLGKRVPINHHGGEAVGEVISNGAIMGIDFSKVCELSVRGL